MARIYKRSPVYYIDYALNGRRIRKKVGKSKRVAELVLQNLEAKLAKGEIVFGYINF